MILAAARPTWVARLDELHLLTPLRMVAVFVVAAVVTIILQWLVKRFVRRTLVVPGTDRRRAAARQNAVVGTVRSAVIGVIWTAAVITAVGELGFNIGGVVTTATVIGGAIAFGAQSLVRDVIGGFYVLVEDQFGVGDVVDLGPCRGTVERVSMRGVRLRDSDNRIWYMAHGNVTRVANMSQGGSDVAPMPTSSS